MKRPTVMRGYPKGAGPNKIITIVLMLIGLVAIGVYVYVIGSGVIADMILTGRGL